MSWRLYDKSHFNDSNPCRHMIFFLCPLPYLVFFTGRLIKRSLPQEILPSWFGPKHSKGNWCLAFPPRTANHRNLSIVSIANIL